MSWLLWLLIPAVAAVGAARYLARRRSLPALPPPSRPADHAPDADRPDPSEAGPADPRSRSG